MSGYELRQQANERAAGFRLRNLVWSARPSVVRFLLGQPISPGCEMCQHLIRGEGVPTLAPCLVAGRQPRLRRQRRGEDKSGDILGRLAASQWDMSTGTVIA
jgi:hypothetical protein